MYVRIVCANDGKSSARIAHGAAVCMWVLRNVKPLSIIYARAQRAIWLRADRA